MMEKVSSKNVSCQPFSWATGKELDWEGVVGFYI